MTENIRPIEEILMELKEATIKRATVRHDQYWLTRWCNYGMPLSEVDKSTKAHFSKSFLGGVKIKDADERTLREGFKRLDHAVADGTYGRCMRLVKELNEALAALGLKTVKDPDKFIDWLTFCYKPRIGGDGQMIEEKPYGFPILDFYDERNRREFWTEVQALLKVGRIANMQYIATIVISKRSNTVSIK